MRALALCAALAAAPLALGLAPQEAAQDPSAAAAAPAARQARPRVTTFLMFEGEAEEAMTFYVSLFEDARVERIERYGPGELGKEGAVRHATFSLAGQLLHCTDSGFDHPFTFTPSISLYVACDSQEEIERLHAALSEEGEVLMPLGKYPYIPGSRAFSWVQDRFGVSWQLDLAGD